MPANMAKHTLRIVAAGTVGQYNPMTVDGAVATAAGNAVGFAQTGGATGAPDPRPPLANEHKGFEIRDGVAVLPVADGTAVVGSGVKTTEVVAGAYKRLATQYAPLSDAGRSSIQKQVDYFYSVFVNAVAGNRGGSERQVLRDMADGRICIGQQAIRRRPGRRRHGHAQCAGCAAES